MYTVFSERGHQSINGFVHPTLASTYFRYFMELEKNQPPAPPQRRFHRTENGPWNENIEKPRKSGSLNRGGFFLKANLTANNKDIVLTNLLVNSKSLVEKITGVRLHTSHYFMRNYKKDQEVKPHYDRLACEISVSLCIGMTKIDSPTWPLHIIGKDGIETAAHMLPGDAVVYLGCELKHWRNVWLDSNWSEEDRLCQVFLHYVNYNNKKHADGEGGGSGEKIAILNHQAGIDNSTEEDERK